MQAAWLEYFSLSSPPEQPQSGSKHSVDELQAQHTEQSHAGKECDTNPTTLPHNTACQCRVVQESAVRCAVRISSQGRCKGAKLQWCVGA